MLKRIIVGSREDAPRFSVDEPYAVISFVGTNQNRSAPRLIKSSNLYGRIIIRADDCYDRPNRSGVPLSGAQADRIAKFVRRVAPHVRTLFIHCLYGEGRSPGAAMPIARAFHLPADVFAHAPFVPNGHVITLVSQALEKLGYDCGPDNLATCDPLYAALVSD